MIYYCELIADEEHGGYEVHFHDFECCCTQGDDKEHALEMAKEVLNGHLKVYLKYKDTIPKPTDYSQKSNYYPIEVHEDIRECMMEDKQELKKDIMPLSV